MMRFFILPRCRYAIFCQSPNLTASKTLEAVQFPTFLTAAAGNITRYRIPTTISAIPIP